MKIELNKNQDHQCLFHDGCDWSPACYIKFSIKEWENENFNCGGLIKNMNKGNCPLLKYKKITVELKEK